jgi:hypothetical protein
MISYFYRILVNFSNSPAIQADVVLEWITSFLFHPRLKMISNSYHHINGVLIGNRYVQYKKRKQTERLNKWFLAETSQIESQHRKVIRFSAVVHFTRVHLTCLLIESCSSAQILPFMILIQNCLKVAVQYHPWNMRNVCSIVSASSRASLSAAKEYKFHRHRMKKHNFKWMGLWMKYRWNIHSQFWNFFVFFDYCQTTPVEKVILDECNCTFWFWLTFYFKQKWFSSSS